MAAFLSHSQCGDTPVKPVIRHGRASDLIVATAKRLRADLVVVGTIGRTGLPYILLGSVAEHVLREVNCDVLVARSEAFRFELP